MNLTTETRTKANNLLYLLSQRSGYNIVAETLEKEISSELEYKLQLGEGNLRQWLYLIKDLSSEMDFKL